MPRTNGTFDIDNGNTVIAGYTPASSAGLGMTGGDWISAGVQLVGAGLNTWSQHETNEANKEISQKNYDSIMQTNAMNKELTEKTWERDDSQLQRARADAQAAGFSPMAALSNNLTNSSPLQMQAPQYTHQQIAPQIDLSNVGNVFSQAGLKKQQIEQLRLQNQFNQETLNLRKLQTATELQKMLKELDTQNLSNAEKASVLLASGFTKNQVEKLIKYTPNDIPKNTSQDTLNQLQKAQTNLANAQTTTQGKLQSLYAQQEALALINTTQLQNDNDFWYKKFDDDGAINIQVPVKSDSGKWSTMPLKTKGKNRKELFQSYESYLNDFINSMATYNFNWESSDMKLLNDIANNNREAILDLIKSLKL